MIGGLIAGLVARPAMRAALRWGAAALAIVLFLLALRRAGRLAEKLETMETTHDVQRRMLDAPARRPRDRDDLARRMRGGGF